MIGTPIGNREDLSPRARRALFEADLLLCEDTRSPLRLVGDEAEALPPRMSCFVGNEHGRLDVLREALAAGKRVAFVSEAGMPVWSDPGRLLVETAWEEGAELDVVPGPTAAASALVLSGFEAEGAIFAGFVDRAGKARTVALSAFAHAGVAVIFYEAGNRVPGLLRDLAKASGANARVQRVLVARELTKKHQELMRDSLAGLAEATDEPLRGEVCVVVEGVASDHEAQSGPSPACELFELMLDGGLKPRARAKAIAALTGLDAKTVYDRLNKAEDEP